MSKNEELNEIAKNSKYLSMCNEYMIKYSSRLFERFFCGDSCLELGPAEGVMTSFLIKRFKNLTVVDGSDVFCKNIEKNFPEVTVVNSLFEEYELNQQFDTIILGHVLEHVDDPVKVLSKVMKNLKQNGVLIASVPNSNSIHRQAALEMGIIKSVDELSELDLFHGHKRVYNLNSLVEHFKEADLDIVKSGGYWLKPLSNKQIEESWSESMLEAFFVLGERYPDIAAEVYVVARVR